jgi:hypothetical protein
MLRRAGQAQPVDGSKHDYTLTFAVGQCPPVNTLWWVTMYDGGDTTADRQSEQPLGHAAGREKRGGLDLAHQTVRSATILFSHLEVTE